MMTELSKKEKTTLIGKQCLDCFSYLVFSEHSTESHVAQSVANSMADPGVARSIPALSHTFMEIEHEIISTVPLIQEGLLSVTGKVCA